MIRFSGHSPKRRWRKINDTSIGGLASHTPRDPFHIMKTKPKILVIVGPTASGKSEIAVRAAKLFGGEIISADSRQVYRGLDIGTGKITPEEMRGVAHHLLDVANPRETFTVSDYKKLAREATTDILHRGKLPIICGGTGLYVNTLVDNLIIPEVAPNEKLRSELATKTAEELFSKLRALDPLRAETIDRHNPRRLVRAIEIATALGSVPQKSYGVTAYEPIIVGALRDPAELKTRISSRLRARLKNGMVEEAKKLHREGLPFVRMESLGLEYNYLAEYLQKKLTREEMAKKLERAIAHYAKRQMTWFKKDRRIVWLTPPEILPYLQTLFVSR